MGFLEREGQLSALLDHLEKVRASGHLVLISGEAGAGKSTLIQEFRRRHLQNCRVLVGRCDDLFAPRPFGPLADIARDQPGPLGQALAGGDQAQVFDAFLAELVYPSKPVVVVLEDLQWADEATLDLVRFVARRLDALPCLILATHRSELAVDHPLRRAAGSLVGPNVSRLQVPPLSVDAVRALVAGTGVDPVALHARTGGNPFFVTELLGGEPGALPFTVRDTILARATHLGGAARDALDAAAVLGRRADADLIQAVGDCDTRAIDECVEAGLLIDDGAHQSFRHDLTRQAIEEALTPLRRRQLHGRALHALGDDCDIVGRAHHAISAGDRDAIVDLAARAAHHCLALGAIREAAALYGSALANADGIDTPTRLLLLESRARTCERVEQLDEAITAGEALCDILSVSSDERAKGTWDGWLGGVYRRAGRAEDAWLALRGAVQRLEPIGESADLARALGMLAQHHMVSGRSADAIAIARRAQAMAERFGAEDVAVHAMDTYGTAMTCGGDDAGIDVLLDALDRAKRAGIHHEVTRTTANLADVLLRGPQPIDALPHLDLAVAVAIEHQLQFGRNSLLNLRSRALFMLGRWDEAVADVHAVLHEVDLAAANRCSAVLCLGRIRARRGDPSSFEALEDALALALPFAEMQMIHPVHVALAEAAWLAGDTERAAREVGAAMPFSVEHPEPWYLGELALWARRTSLEWSSTIEVPEPFARMLAGDARGAAASWQERGCRYEAADALGDSTDVADLREALEELADLGARPRAKQITRRLRELGVRDLPRGPRASTRANAARLTARELEVAALLAEGLANSEIAERLVLSPKTVDHHVSAVLAKLSVPNRRQVAKAAAHLGLDFNDVA